MKKILLSVIVLLVLAGGATACGSVGNVGAAGGPTTANGTNPTTSATSGSSQVPPAGGASWGDVPIYPGATQAQGGGEVAPLPGSGISKVEARYYETRDPADKVESYYKSQLPADGWQSQGWVEVGMIGGVYVKSDTESLQVSILPAGPDGKTVITLVKGTK